MLDEARLALLFGRAVGRRWDSFPATLGLELATLGGARALGLDREVGSLETGSPPISRRSPSTALHAQPVQDPESALLFATSGRGATLVAVAGEELVRDGRLVRGDRRRHRDRSRQAATESATRSPPARPESLAGSAAGGSSFLTSSGTTANGGESAMQDRASGTQDRASGKTAKIWRDGALVNWEDANIHVISHVAHYGSSVFEGIRSYETPNGGAIFRLRDHMRRLHDSCRIYRMPMAYSVDELMQATVDTIAANDLTACYIRPIALRTGEQMGFYPDRRSGRDVHHLLEVGHVPRSPGATRKAPTPASRAGAALRPDTYPTHGQGRRELPELPALEDRGAAGRLPRGASRSTPLGTSRKGAAKTCSSFVTTCCTRRRIAAGILHGITRDTVMRTGARPRIRGPRA